MNMRQRRKGKHKLARPMSKYEREVYTFLRGMPDFARAANRLSRALSGALQAFEKARFPTLPNALVRPAD